MFKNCVKLILMILKIQITDNYLSDAGISNSLFVFFVHLCLSTSAGKRLKKRIHFLPLMIAAANTAEDN